MPSFNLLDRPWVPCLTQTGRPVDISLREAITSAHEYRELFDPSPLVTVALHRLLIALAQRVCPVSTAPEWHTAWSTGRFDARAAERYCTRYADRFDLFHPQRPFMQSQLGDSAKPHPGTWLMQEAASGNNPTLFDHSSDSLPPALPPAVAARCLLATVAAALGGGLSEPFNFCDAPLARDATGLIYGRNLFETLMLNMPPAPVADGDAPFWELDTQPTPDRDGTPVPGDLALFTWPARRVRLVADPDTGNVTVCKVQQGLVTPAGYHDPHKAYRREAGGAASPVRLTSERAIWRDLPLWFGLNLDSRCPDPVAWLRSQMNEPSNALHISSQLQLAVFGLVTTPGRASVLLWRHERFPLPAFCLRDSEAIHQFTSALRRAEDCSAAVGTTLAFLDRLAGVPQGAAESAAQEASLTYWARLEQPARDFVVSLAAAGQTAVARWDEHVALATVESFRGAAIRVARVRPSGRARGLAAAERFLAQRLATLLPATVDRVQVRGDLTDVS